MIITIDGPAGAGKSTAAKALARRLSFEYLDTGAMFRAIALAGLRAGTDLRSEAALGQLIATLRLEIHEGRMVLNGEDVSGLIRTSAVTAASSPIAESPAVRRFLAAMQRNLADGRDMVCEGRDQGTVVFPDATCKFFLQADPVERARRRQRDLLARGEAVPWEEVLRAQEQRDRRDSARDIAPMVPAADAIRLDSTHLSLDEVVECMEQEVRRRTLQAAD